MKKFITILGLMILIIIMSYNDKDTQTETPGLFEIKWVLYKYENPAVDPLEFIIEENEDYWIIFNDDNTTASQNACNGCSGTFELLENEVISIFETVCSDAVCEGSDWLGGINGTFVYELNGDSLLVLTQNHANSGQEKYYFRTE